MDMTPIIARLKAQLTGFVLISGVADLDAAIASTSVAPAAYCLPLAESAEGPDMLGVHHQRIAQEFGVVLVISNLRDATGTAAAADLAAKRIALRAALMGWVPDASNGEPVSFTSGRILRFENQQLWWTDEFRVKTDYRI
ncbi:hypothetical protein LNV08_11700 [Paucibacter sp. TC2R-5]|uniref:phage tail terminator protein n=1 Tax=Paucibacter sp. TC2R-5 TaxID=2893555 RepID=UPI0021E4795F|nr:hypothetical protein [Paucibacter sp. TC2R-5]MCV2359633.1 hypothetical protein [Paucibacter sp. TC2R-5]